MIYRIEERFGDGRVIAFEFAEMAAALRAFDKRLSVASESSASLGVFNPFDARARVRRLVLLGVDSLRRAASVDEPIPALRSGCPKCGRFIAQAAIVSYDEIDPGAYYGVRGVTTGDCTRCGTVDDPTFVRVGESS